MKTFEQDGKINFVDDNNVFVGFDYQQDCCESFGYYLTKEIPQRPAGDKYEDRYWSPTGLTLTDKDTKGYRFDTTFFKRLTNEEMYTEDGGAVCFRLTKTDNRAKNGVLELFLTLYNSHNGYYGHGFTVTVGGVPLHEGYL